jgi:hypothetical protein
MSEKPLSGTTTRYDARKRLPYLVGNRCRHRFKVHELVVSLALQLFHRAAELIRASTQLSYQPRIFNRDYSLIRKVSFE